MDPGGGLQHPAVGLQRIERRIPGRSLPGLPDLEPALPTLPGNGASGGSGFQQRRHHDLVRISEAGFLAADRPDADALLDRMAGAFDLLILQPPGFGAALLEIQIAAVDGVAEQTGQSLVQIRLAETGGGQQALAGQHQSVGRHDSPISQ